jgi:predicted N-formylglutamate amidohydrolase
MAKPVDDSATVSTRRLDAAQDDPVIVCNPGAASPYLLLGDHAGRAIPARLGGLGLAAADQMRHIAWDIGVAELGCELAARLNATFIAQRFSRLVIDCNRHPDHPASIAEESDGSPIPGNVGLGDLERARRRREIFLPYHAAISAALDAGPATKVIALHSFTPSMQGQARPWRFGVLHREDSPLSRLVLARLRGALDKDVVGDNQPYRMDATDFTVPNHCDPRGLDYLELEVRQDLLVGAAACAKVSAIIAEALR